MFVDKISIFCKAGNGGDGAVSWRREKFVPRGGPDGGDGGRGGNIYFQLDQEMHTLSKFLYKKRYFAENGEKGGKSNRAGRAGKDLIITVPHGTILRDADTNEIIADLMKPNENFLILKGGKGGRGNARFKSSTRQSPSFSELGEETEVVKIELELKMIANVGLVGLPNVGKSTLLSSISAATPKIADYPFTTLLPILGVVKHYEESFIVADIPGLIEGASKGKGLGFDFLKHIERVQLIVHVIDATTINIEDPLKDYIIIREELEKYSPSLSNYKEIIVLNKIDMLETDDTIKSFKEKIKKEIFSISALRNEGLDSLLNRVASELKEIPEQRVFSNEVKVYETKVSRDYSVAINEGEYYITGGLMEELARKVVLNDDASFRWFQKMLRVYGVIDKLKELGIKPGDIIHIFNIEFEYVD